MMTRKLLGRISRWKGTLFAPKISKSLLSQRINAYGRLNQRMMELDDDIKEHKVNALQIWVTKYVTGSLQNLVQEILDAQQDIEGLLDDDACK